MSNAAFVAAAVLLYRLGQKVLSDERAACVAALLFCVNPASVFFSAIYTESLFAMASFAGMLFGVSFQRGVCASPPTPVLPLGCRHCSIVENMNNILHYLYSG